MLFLTVNLHCCPQLILFLSGNAHSTVMVFRIESIRCSPYHIYGKEKRPMLDLHDKLTLTAKDLILASMLNLFLTVNLHCSPQFMLFLTVNVRCYLQLMLFLTFNVRCCSQVMLFLTVNVHCCLQLVVFLSCKC